MTGARAYIGSLLDQSYEDTIRAGLEYIRFGDLVRPGPRVFLKPNLTFPTYRPGVMTSVAAVEAAIAAIREYTPNISLGDADSGGYNPFSMDEVYSEIGMYDVAKRYDADVVNLSRLPRRAVSVDLGRRRIQLELPKLLTDEIDLLVTLPVPKIHMNTGVSLTFKNQWGCIPEPNDRLRLHPSFAQVILAVNRLIHSKVAIVDGKWGLNVSGPMRGNPVELDWVLVTDDIGAGARLCCELMQIPMESIAHLRYAEREGAIPPRQEIELNRDLRPFLKDPFVLRRQWTDYPGAIAFRSRAIAYLAYFSPLAAALHKVLYLFREPFYDYAGNKPSSSDD